MLYLIWVVAKLALLCIPLAAMVTLPAAVAFTLTGKLGLKENYRELLPWVYLILFFVLLTFR